MATSHHETSRSQRRAAAVAANQNARRIRMRPICAAVLAVMPALAGANIVADPNAAQRASVGQTANGTPLVNIVDPNQRGISHNKFTELNVGAGGAVFNNSMKDGVSAIGGMAMNNPNLNREARAIIGEVTGKNGSAINGAMEIFGRKADLIIANPNGIQVNGASTVNMNSLTLSTGKPVTQPDGSVRLGVEGGTVGINGAGISTEGLSHFDIISRAAQINGEINGPAEVKVVAGRGEYDTETRTHTAAPDAAAEQEFAIDASALGSMYGGRIELVATDKGAGVRHHGVLLANQQISVSADGDIVLGAAQSRDSHIALEGRNVTVNGTPETDRIGLIGKTGVSIDARDAVDLNANLDADGNLGVKAGKSVDIDGDMVSREGQIGIEAGDALRTNGVLAAKGSMTLDAGGDASLRGELISESDISIDGNKSVSMDVAAVAQGRIGIQAGDNAEIAGTLASHDDIAIEADKAARVAAHMESLGNMAIRAGEGADVTGTLVSHRNLSVDAGTTASLDAALASKGNTSVTAATSASVKGHIATDGDVSVKAGGALDMGATVSSLGNVALDSGDAMTVNGAIASRGDIAVKALQSLGLNADLITDAGVIAIDAASLVQTAASILARGAKAEGAEVPAVRITVGDYRIDGELYAIDADGRRIDGARIVLDGGAYVVLDTVGAVVANAGVVSTAQVGAVGGDVSVVAKNLENNGGALVAADGTLEIAAESLFRNAGTLTASGDMDLKARTVANQGVLNARVLRMVAEEIRNQGGIGAAKVALDASALDNAGVIRGTTLGIKTGTVGNTGTAAGTDVALTTDSLVNTGALTGTNSLALDVADKLDNAGMVISGGDLAIDGTKTVVNRDGGRLQGNTVAVSNVGSVTNENGGLLVSAGELSLTKIDTLRNDASTIQGVGVSIDGVRGISNTNAGAIMSQGSMSVTDADSIVNNGSMLGARGNLTMDNIGAIDNDAGALSAGGTLSVENVKTFANRNAARTMGDVALRMKQVEALSNSGSISSSQGDVSMAGMKRLDNEKGTVVAGGDVAITAEAARNIGGTIGTNQGNVSLKGLKTLDNDEGGRVVAGGDIDIEAEAVRNAGGSVMRGEAELRLAAKTVENTGKGSQISAGVRLDVDADAVDNADSALIHAAEELDVDARTVTNRDSATLFSGDVATVRAEKIENRSQATLGSDGGALTLKSDTEVINDKGTIVGGDIDIAATKLDNRNGDIEGYGSVKVAVDNLSNADGTIWADNKLHVSVKEDLVFGGDAGALNAGKHLKVSTTGNIHVDRAVENLGIIEMEAAKNLVNRSSIVSAKAVDLKARQITNNPNSLIWGMNDVSLKGEDSIVNARNANILSQGTMSLQGEKVVNDAGSIRAEGDMAIDARSLQNRSAYTGNTDGVSGPETTEHREERFSFRAAQTVVVKLDITLPSLTSDIALEKSAEISAGGNLKINQRGLYSANQDGSFDSVLNEGGLISAGKNLHVKGNVVNQPKRAEVSMHDFVQQKLNTPIYMDGSKDRDQPVGFDNLYLFLDFLYGYSDSGSYWYNWYRNDGNPQAVMRTMEGATISTVMSTLFGPTWKAMSNGEMESRWSELKANDQALLKENKIYFLPQEKGALTAGGNFIHQGGSFVNGIDGVNVDNRKIDVKIGSKDVSILTPTYDVKINLKKFEELGMGVSTLPALADLEKISGMFEPSSGWLARNVDDAGASGIDDGVSGIGNGMAGTTVPKRGSSGLPSNGAKVVPKYETRLAYIDQSKFHGSDYFFSQVGYNPEQPVYVIGDNYFISELIRRQMNDAVGAFFAVRNGVQGTGLVKMLMDNASSTGELKLEVGKALTAEQMAGLTTDIIWFVSETIDGVDVLVPRVYLAPTTLAQIRDDEGSGAAIVHAGGTIAMDAESVRNASGSMSAGKDISIVTTGDIVNASAGMNGGLSAGGSIELISTKGNVINNGASVKAGGNASLIALEGDTTITASAGYDANGKLKVHNFDDGILAGGDVNIGGRNVTLNSAEITAGQNATIVAKDGDLRSNEMHEADSSYEYERTKGVLNYTSYEKTTASAKGIGSNIKAGETLGMQAGNDIVLEGGSLQGKAGNLNAGNKVDVKTSTDYDYLSEKKVVSQFGYSAGVKAAGFEASASGGTQSGATQYAGVSDVRNAGEVGSSNASSGRKPGRAAIDESVGAKFGIGRTTETYSEESTRHTNTEMDFGDGGLAMGGKTVDLGGATIQTPGTVSVKADTVDTTKYVDERKTDYSKKEFLIGVNIEGHSSVADAVTKYGELGNKAKEGNSTDAGMTALQVLGDVSNMVFNDLAGGSVGVGMSFDKTTTSTVDKSENITKIDAGRIDIQATDDVNLNGVQMRAGEASIDAGGDVSMNAAKSWSEMTSSTKSFNARVSGGDSVSITGVGAGVSADVGGSNDNQSSQAVKHTSTSLEADKVSIRSGGDTTLAGANVVGDDVSVKTGGNLNVESVQDTLEFDRSKSNWGVSVGAAVTIVNGQPMIMPTFSADGGGGSEYRNENTTGIQSGISGKTVAVDAAGDLNLSGAHIVATSGEGAVNVGGAVNARSLDDNIDQDGGYGGGGGGVSKTGLGTVSAWGETVDEIHKQDRHAATIAGATVNAGSINGTINTDDSKLTTNLRDEKTSGNKMSFTLGVGDVADAIKGARKKGSYDLNPDTSDGGSYRPLGSPDDGPRRAASDDADGGSGRRDSTGTVYDKPWVSPPDLTPDATPRKADVPNVGNDGGKPDGKRQDFSSQTDFDDGTPGNSGRSSISEPDNQVRRATETVVPDLPAVKPMDPVVTETARQSTEPGLASPEDVTTRGAQVVDPADTTAAPRKTWTVDFPPPMIGSPGSATATPGFNGARDPNTNTGKDTTPTRATVSGDNGINRAGPGIADGDGPRVTLSVGSSTGAGGFQSPSTDGNPNAHSFTDWKGSSNGNGNSSPVGDYSSPMVTGEVSFGKMGYTTNPAEIPRK